MEEKFVCTNCVKDLELINWIQNNCINSSTLCSFCNVYNSRKDCAICVALDSFIAHCIEIINDKYISAEDAEVYPDSVDGDIPIEHFTAKEIVDLYNDEFKIVHMEIVNAIVEELESVCNIWFSRELIN